MWIWLKKFNAINLDCCSWLYPEGVKTQDQWSLNDRSLTTDRFFLLINLSIEMISDQKNDQWWSFTQKRSLISDQNDQHWSLISLSSERSVIKKIEQCWSFDQWRSLINLSSEWSVIKKIEHHWSFDHCWSFEQWSHRPLIIDHFDW